MNLPDFNISNHVHRRWCRFIIQRYLGQFLERNLLLEQLSVELSSGRVHVQEVNINVHYVNDLLTSLNIPLKLVDGFIGRISIEVPWMSLVSEASRLNVEDLQLTFQAKDFVKLDDKDLVASMLGSVVESLVSSRELARSFCEEQEQNGEASEVDGQDGIKAFTKVIDAIVSRFCMELTNTTIRLENPPQPQSDMCTALEFRIKKVEFMDEQMKILQQEGKGAETITAQPQGIGSITNLNKYLLISGVEAFTDVFSRIDEQPMVDPNSTSLVVTSMYIRREKLKQKSPTHSPNQSMSADLFTSTMTSATNFQSCHSTLPESSNSTEFKVMKAQPDLCSDPIKFAEIIDNSSMTVRIVNSDSSMDNADSKVELDFNCKGLHVFITPSQIEIVKRFFSSMVLPSSQESRNEMGKRMEKEDYDVIVKTMEDITYQNSGQAGGSGLSEGNWRQQDDFREFDPINLEEQRAQRKSSETPHGYKSLKNENAGRRESMHLKATITTVLVYVSQEDPMGTESVQKMENGHDDVIRRLQMLSNQFFSRAAHLRINPATPLNSIRTTTDNLYKDNHVRFVGSAVSFNYNMEKSSTGEHMTIKLMVNNCDCTEYLKSDSNPCDPSTNHYALLDFSDNDERDPHLKLIYSVSGPEKAQTTSQIYIGNCRTELDLSIVDRLSDLIAPRPFFDNPLYGRARADSLGRKENLHLSEDLFAQTTTEEAVSGTTWVVTCDDLTIDLRVPVADLRNPTIARPDYRLRHVHPEYVKLNLKGATIELPFVDETVSVTLTCNEMIGDFCGLSDKMDVSDHERRFLYAGKKGLDKKVQIKFSYDPRNKCLKTSSSGHHLLPTGADAMTESVLLPVLQSQTLREGPFSRTRRQFSESQDDIIHAGTRDEMERFADDCVSISDTVIHLELPILRLFVASHPLLEVLYNRLVNDLALWQPAAPGLRPSGSDLNVNVLAEQFHEYKGNDRAPDDEDETLEGEPSAAEPNSFDRNKSHTFSLTMNVAKGSILLGTTVTENGSACGPGQVSVDLADSQLFTVVGYHQDMNHTFFHFTTNQLNIGQRNFELFTKRGMMPKNVCQKDFGNWHKDEYQLESIKISDQFHNSKKGDALAVALHMHARPEVNVKDVLLAVAVRNTCVRVRPFRDPGHLWVSQLTSLFNLKDYEIPGYELPLVTNDIQVQLDNVVLAYDHSCVKPESSQRLRLVLGSTNITSSIITSMEVSKFTCIFEESRLYMSNEKVRETVRINDPRDSTRADSDPAAKDRSFIQIMDIGLFHLEVFYSLLSESELSRRLTPLVEIRCRNDIIKVWSCADSLVALINMMSEMSQSETMRPVTPVEPPMEHSPQDSMINEDTTSEACGSTWSRPASLIKPESTQLPEPIEKKLQAMVMSAMRETTTRLSSEEAIAVGEDAVEEFSQNFSLNQRSKELLSDALTSDDFHERTRQFSLSTDDEFCMVDDDVIGSGITNAAGEPTIKMIAKKQPNEGISIDSQHFRIPDEFRADGLGALQEKNPPPLLRYLVRDVTLHLHLYGGSDLAKEELKPRSYSSEDYRKGTGKGQKVPNEARGGPQRDHSVSVVLEVNKITYLYQLFHKDAPVMCTTLFSIQDIVVKDRLTLSNIKEMLYQYSNSEQPRRTCAPMVAVRIVESHTQEGKMRISLLPIKMNIDQDTMNFLEDFVADISNSIRLPNEVTEAVANRPLREVPAVPATREERARLKMPPQSLNLEPLTPSPVQPPSPLGDLSYLVNRSNSHDSPVKRPLIDGPLTASAVSIGNLFGNRSQASHRTFSPEGTSSSPDLIAVTEESDGLELSDDLLDLGDWNDSIDMKPLASSSRADEILARSTMEGSIRPDVLEDDLVDTSSGDIRDNDRSTICDEDTDTEMGESMERTKEELDPEQIRGSTFFKEFTFSPEVYIYIDYHGKNKISMDKGGAMLGVLKGIGQLNHTKILLKEIQYRNGLLGVGRCLNHAKNEWAEDIITNLPNVFTSCGPISPLVQIGKGFMDLFWLPVSELRKEDGHVVKGLQRGVGSFGLSSAAGLVGIAQSMVGVVQMVAETVLYEVQPDPAYLNKRNRRVSTRPAAPTDLKHSMQRVYGIVSDGVRQTRDDLELATQEDRASGNSSFRSLFRFATPAVIRPLVMGSQISYQLLGGLRSQLRPDQYQDERHKWRDDEVPGGHG